VTTPPGKIPEKLPDLPTFRQRVAWARERRGLVAAELSVSAGLSHSVVSRIERDEQKSVDAHTAFKLADTLGVDVRWLVLGYGDGSEYHSQRGRRARPRSAAAIEAEKVIAKQAKKVSQQR